MCYEEKETIEDMWNECSKIRGKRRKQRGEIPNEDERDIRWMKEILKRSERIEKGWRIGKMLIFGIIIFVFVIKNSKARRANKALSRIH
jgi:hypothetical protein